MNVTDVTGRFIASIAIGFMEDCDSRSWTFVEEVLADCVSSAGLLLTMSREQADIRTLPMAGDYIFQRNGRRRHWAEVATAEFIARR